MKQWQKRKHFTRLIVCWCPQARNLSLLMCMIGLLNMSFIFRVTYGLLSDSMREHLLLLSQTHKRRKWIHRIWERNNKSHLDKSWIGIKSNQVKERKVGWDFWKEFDSQNPIGQLNFEHYMTGTSTERMLQFAREMALCMKNQREWPS